MKEIKKYLGTLSLAIAAVMLAFTTNVMAHVTVKPSEVTVLSRETFSVSVPNEHDTPVVAVRLIIPEGLESVRPYAKAGWNVQVTKSGEGEEASATEITWTGGSVPVDLKDDFLFGAKTPADASELKWKAYETYGDGSVVAWEQDPSEAEDNKPYSITKVVSETEQDAAIKAVQQETADAKTVAGRGLAAGVVGILISLVAIGLATRRKA